MSGTDERRGQSQFLSDSVDLQPELRARMVPIEGVVGVGGEEVGGSTGWILAPPI